MSRSVASVAAPWSVTRRATTASAGAGRSSGSTLGNAVHFDVYLAVACKVACDPFDPDPDRRYKLPALQIEGPILDNNITGTLYTSPDGIS